ncbi:hypothetical protein EU538_10930 [Candidatus Thorarchaeota archaeon]|nr:MAG: hypothetical protein EU538_10930 [Candidatus Thorarchaeota archaeon]
MNLFFCQLSAPPNRKLKKDSPSPMNWPTQEVQMVGFYLKRHPSILVVVSFVLLLLAPHHSTSPARVLQQERISDQGDETSVLPTYHNPVETHSSSEIDMTAVPYSVYHGDGAFEGYNLFALGEYNRNTGTVANQLLIMDMDGNIVYDRYVGDRNTFSCPVELINPNTALIGVPTGAALLHLDNDSVHELGFSGHHEYEYNPNNDTYFTLKRIVQEFDGTEYLFDTILEFTPTGSMVWGLNVSDFISPSQWCPYHDYASGNPDVSHSNTVFYDAENDVIYYNSRNTNTFYKIDHATKEVIWGLGEYGNFMMYDIYGNERNSLFYHAHSVEPLDEDELILFDNDLHNQTSVTNHISRMLEITINETTMTANQSWMWQAPTAYYSAGWGDADRLPNGNRLGTFGYWSSGGLFSSSLVEVNPSGDIVWEVQFDYTSDCMYGVYRMERIRFEPSLSSSNDGDVLSSESPLLSWDCWYDFRNKEECLGNYTLFVDGIFRSEGAFNYQTFWRPTKLEFDLSDIALGSHNASLVIDDGYGNTANDTIEFSITAFSISRESPDIVEQTNPAHTIEWTGFTPTPLTCNITCNGTQCLLLEWLGEDILLYPANLSLGVNHLVLELWNGTEMVYWEELWIEMTPPLPPMVTQGQTSPVEIFWNMSHTLTWSLHDISPQSWTLLVDDQVYLTGVQSSRDYEVSWDIPRLDEGTYEIELLVTDQLNMTSIAPLTLVIQPPHPPAIDTSLLDTEIIWGTEDVSLKWRLHGSQQWWLYRNGSLFDSDTSAEIDIEITIESWQREAWRLGTYNLTLLSSDGNQNASSTTWVDVIYSRGDPFADSFAETRSSWYLMGSNAVGPPDGNTATIFLDYGNGYLTLDMGKYGHILNGGGMDFTIVAGGGEYTVSVGNSLSDVFASLGHATGNQSFDLLPTGLASVRYVMIEYHDGDAVLLDGIVAIHFDVVTDDATPPIVEGPEDISSVFNETTYELHWSCSDATPWSYSILIDDVTVESGPWEGEDISLSYLQEAAGTVNITLVLTDLFGNNATDEVRVTLESHTPPSDNLILTVVIGVAVIGVAAVSVVVYVRRR